MRIRVLLQSRVSKLLGGLLLESMAAGHLLTAHMCRQQLGERAGGASFRVAAAAAAACARSLGAGAGGLLSSQSVCRCLTLICDAPPARVYGSGWCVCAAMMRLLPSTPSCAPHLSRPTQPRSEFGGRLAARVPLPVLQSSRHMGSFLLHTERAVPAPANATASSAVGQGISLMPHTKPRAAPAHACVLAFTSALDRYPSLILPGFLYLGDWGDAEQQERLQELKIKR